MKIEIGPVGWACIFGLGCAYPDLYEKLIAFFIIFVLLIFGFLLIAPVADVHSYKELEVDLTIKEKENYLKIEEVEFSVLVERGKKIWEERKKEIAREKETVREKESSRELKRLQKVYN